MTTQEVNNYYQTFWGRPANQGELDFWSTQTKEALSEQFVNDIKNSNEFKANPEMVTWIEGNATLLPTLIDNGYNFTDITNEAYSWVTNDHSAFSGDMMSTSRADNGGYTAPNTNGGGTTTPVTVAGYSKSDATKDPRVLNAPNSAAIIAEINYRDSNGATFSDTDFSENNYERTMESLLNYYGNQDGSYSYMTMDDYNANNGYTGTTDTGTTDTGTTDTGTTDTGTTDTGTTDTDTGTGDGEINTQAAYAVNQMYQKYFGRQATTGAGGELEYWSTQPLSELQTQLEADYQNTTGHAYDGSPIMPGNQQSNIDLQSDENTAASIAVLDDALANRTITRDVYEIWKLAVENYPPGVEFDAAQIIETFENIQSETIDPYYDELISVAKADIQTAFDAIEGKRARELETEGILASEKIKKEKGSLESSGMTFTGKAVDRLGAESAYTENGNVPFGGELGEGIVPTENRLIASSSAANYDQDVYGLVSSAEDYLGSEIVDGMNLPGIDRPDVDTTGAVQTEREGTEGGVLQRLIDQQNEISQLNTINNIS